MTEKLNETFIILTKKKEPKYKCQKHGNLNNSEAFFISWGTDEGKVLLSRRVCLLCVIELMEKTFPDLIVIDD